MEPKRAGGLPDSAETPPIITALFILFIGLNFAI